MKTEFIGIRVSKNEKDIIKEKAEELRLPISLFIRNLVLNFLEKKEVKECVQVYTEEASIPYTTDISTLLKRQ